MAFLTETEILEQFSSPAQVGDRYLITFGYVNLDFVVLDVAVRETIEFVGGLFSEWEVTEIHFVLVGGEKRVQVTVRYTGGNNLSLPETQGGSEPILVDQNVPISAFAIPAIAAVGAWIVAILPWVAGILGIITIKQIADDVGESPGTFGFGLGAALILGVAAFIFFNRELR